MPQPARPKLSDVAARAGVSAATASLVLRGRPGPSEVTGAAVLAAAGQLGYRADRSASLLARRRTRLLGVTMDVRSSFHGELVESLQAGADRCGYDLVVGPLSRTHNERSAIETLIDFRCEGLLLLGSALAASDIAALGESHAVLSLGRALRSATVDVVRAADDRGVALAVEHLAGLGHVRVAYADGPSSPIATLRRRGFRAAARRLGLTEAVVLEYSMTGERALTNDITAYVAFNDQRALDIVGATRRSGLDVPQQISVVGYDDSPVAALDAIALTSVSQDPQALAAAAITTVTDRLDGRRERVEQVLAPRLVVRRSTAPRR